MVWLRHLLCRIVYQNRRSSGFTQMWLQSARSFLCRIEKNHWKNFIRHLEELLYLEPVHRIHRRRSQDGEVIATRSFHCSSHSRNQHCVVQSRPIFRRRIKSLRSDHVSKPFEAFQNNHVRV